MSNKVQQAAEGLSALTKAGVGVSAAGGVWAWIGNNSAEIGAIAAMAGAACALIGVLYNIIQDQRDRRRQRNYYRGDAAE